MGVPAEALIKTAEIAFGEQPAGTKVKVSILEGIEVFAELDGYQNCSDGKMRIRCIGEGGRIFLMPNEFIKLADEGLKP